MPCICWVVGNSNDQKYKMLVRQYWTTVRCIWHYSSHRHKSRPYATITQDDIGHVTHISWEVIYICCGVWQEGACVYWSGAGYYPTNYSCSLCVYCGRIVTCVWFTPPGGISDYGRSRTCLMLMTSTCVGLPLTCYLCLLSPTPLLVVCLINHVQWALFYRALIYMALLLVMVKDGINERKKEWMNE